MIKKILLLVFVVFLILALTGCTMVPPGESLESMAEESVYSYWQAIINRQYELAKFYCIPDGVWDHKTDEWEEYINTNSEGEASLMIYLYKFYKPTEVIGEDIYDPDIRDNAIVYVEIITHKIPFPGSVVEIDVDVFEYETELLKQNYPPGDWKLK